MIALDDYSFEKIVDGSKTVLVKFDVEYPYGDNEDEFKALMDNLRGKGGTDFVVATVGVAEYGERENDALRERFGYSKDDFPAYRLFPKGTDGTLGGNGVAYAGDRTRGDLSAWVQEHGGVYIACEGCVKALDDIAGRFHGGDHAQLIADAEAHHATLSGADAESGKWYLKIMKKIQGKGAGGAAWAKDEARRLKKLLGSKITAAKKRTFQLRLNLLPSFKKAPKDEL